MQITEEKTTVIDSLGVELPDISSLVADVVRGYRKAFNHYLYDSDKHAESYTRLWFETMLKKGTMIVSKEEYDLANGSLKDSE